MQIDRRWTAAPQASEPPLCRCSCRRPMCVSPHLKRNKAKLHLRAKLTNFPLQHCRHLFATLYDLRTLTTDSVGKGRKLASTKAWEKGSSRAASTTGAAAGAAASITRCCCRHRRRAVACAAGIYLLGDPLHCIQEPSTISTSPRACCLKHTLCTDNIVQVLEASGCCLAHKSTQKHLRK